MKGALFAIIAFLIGWMLVLAYEFVEKIGDHIGCDRETTHGLFWLTIVISVLNEIFKEMKND